MSKTAHAGRFDSPFEVTLATGETILGRAVLDCSGTWNHPRDLPEGSQSKPGGKIFPGVPDLSDPRIASNFLNKRTLVVGSGHSGMTAIIDLMAGERLGEKGRVTWVRRSGHQQLVTPPDSARRRLELRAETIACDNRVEIAQDVWIFRIAEKNGRVLAEGQDQSGQPVTIEADAAVLSTGFRPDLSIFRELWVAVDPRWEAPAALAALIDPDQHGCGDVPAQGLAALSHPERDFFVLGSKSYGRASNFALSKGYEQLDAVLAYLTEKGSQAGDANEQPLPPDSDCVSRLQQQGSGR